MQQEPQSPYDFILQNDPKAKKTKAPSPPSAGTRFLVVVGGVIVLLLLVVVGASVLGGSGGGRDSLLRVVQLQQETIRVTTKIARESSDQTVKNAALTTKLAISSDKTSLGTVIAARNISFKEAELELGVNPETDTRLDTAKAGGLYETTALLVLNEHLRVYQDALSTAFEATKNQNVKDALSVSFQSAKVLREEIEATEL